MPFLDDNERILLHTTEQPRPCVWTGCSIGPDEPAIRFETRLFTDALEHVWCSIGAVDALRRALRSSNPSDGEHSLEPPSGHQSIMFIDKAMERQNYCFCCDEPIASTFYEFHATTKAGQPSLVFCHASCRQQACDYLEDVWNEADDLLGKAL